MANKKKKAKKFADGLAKAIYDGYPSSDLLPIYPPTERTDLTDFAVKIDGGCGDGLFEFIVRELIDGADDDGITRESCVRLLERMQADIQGVLDAVIAHQTTSARKKKK